MPSVFATGTRMIAIAALIAATALGGGAVATAADTGTAVAGTAVTDVSPPAGAVVGIAHPVTVRFADPVTDRTAAERAVSVTASTPVDGSFAWTSDRELTWTPDVFWPGHTAVTVLAGGTRTQFRTGDEFVAVANRSTHQFTVSLNGQVVRTMPASMGKPGYETPVGTFPVLEKFRNLVMDSSTYGVPIDSPEGYRIDTEYAVRLTWGGIFVHAAPWSVDSQGWANVSHGCINLSTENAAWYYDNVAVGDPVIVRG
ncbi:MAG: L,D-transpeptidase [Rhodococcus sp.]|uniref:L,D-transpeptidase n=1 Tax=Rhodococcus TaxID=1827 RepID=UPI0016B9DCDF|nr:MULTISPECIES: L,D-transpeptidase [Rhodococcus]NLV77836.1 L,D-transpeptidase [Rhodococcus sp. (in: high G+C Gram-positive bacteria)]